MNVHDHFTDPTGVKHRWVFDFELVFANKRNLDYVEQWMYDWWWISLPYGFLYIILVLLGEKWMKNRKDKFQLRQPLIIWNTFLALFSLWGAYRCVPEMIHALKENGIQYSICDTTYRQGVTGLWVWLFMFSKVPETIDTLFIILRGQPLIFLHWYHHVSVLIYCFYSYTYFASTGRWFVSMNFCIHTIMYGYFALRAARFPVPRFIQQSITFLQLIQMLIGCLINAAAFDYNQKENQCGTSNTNIILSLTLYASYLILFAHFFYASYLKKDVNRKVKDRSD